jgi:hypothetical protein
VDEDLWLKLDNGSLAWEIVSVALFHLGGQLLCPSPVTTQEKGVLLGGPHKGNILFPTILNTFHPGASPSVPNFGNGSWSILSLEEGLKAQRLIAAAIKRIRK